MKIITGLILVLLFVSIPFTACGEDNGDISSAAYSDAPSYVSEHDDSSDIADESEIASKPEKSAVYSMSLEGIVKEVYAACGKKFNNYINEEIPKEVLAKRYGDGFEYIKAYRSKPFWDIDPYIFELYRVDEGKAEEIAAFIEKKSDLSAEAKITAVNGNVVMICMSTKEECKKLSEAFTGIK